MSSFDDIGVAMIPSGYKEGKLYSVLPNSGDGDFDSHVQQQQQGSIVKD